MTDEALITLAQAANTLPNRPHRATVWRWARKGVLARDGERVYLRVRRYGGCVFTTAMWLAEFAEAVTSADERYHRRARKRHRLDDQDVRVLERAGI